MPVVFASTEWIPEKWMCDHNIEKELRQIGETTESVRSIDMLLKDGQAGLESVILEGEDCLNKQERAEYDRLSTECLQDARKIIKDVVETEKSWKETNLKISKVNRERTAQMFSILENARQGEKEMQHGKG